MKIETCQCGWPIESLKAQLVAAKELLEECRTTSHPMKAAMVAGQQRCVSTLEGHLCEISRSTAQ